MCVVVLLVVDLGFVCCLIFGLDVAFSAVVVVVLCAWTCIGLT